MARLAMMSPAVPAVSHCQGTARFRHADQKRLPASILKLAPKVKRNTPKWAEPGKIHRPTTARRLKSPPGACGQPTWLPVETNAARAGARSRAAPATVLANVGGWGLVAPPSSATTCSAACQAAGAGGVARAAPPRLETTIRERWGSGESAQADLACPRQLTGVAAHPKPRIMKFAFSSRTRLRPSPRRRALWRSLQPRASDARLRARSG
jgi:hypothetical protein